MVVRVVIVFVLELINSALHSVFRSGIKHVVGLDVASWALSFCLVVLLSGIMAKNSDGYIKPILLVVAFWTTSTVTYHPIQAALMYFNVPDSSGISLVGYGAYILLSAVFVLPLYVIVCSITVKLTRNQR